MADPGQSLEDRIAELEQRIAALETFETTTTSSLQFLSGNVGRWNERLSDIEWRQEWEVEAWRRDAASMYSEVERDSLAERVEKYDRYQSLVKSIPGPKDNKDWTQASYDKQVERAYQMIYGRSEQNTGTAGNRKTAPNTFDVGVNFHE